jgi:hypothetical protein
MIGQTLASNERKRLDELFRHERFHLKRIYEELSTPNLAEISGEYDARLLDQGNRIGSFMVRKAFSMRADWLGKAFRPLSPTMGEGYNVFGTANHRRAQLPMSTYIDQSIVTCGDAIILDYRTKNRGLIRWLRGELRQVSPSVLLGLGTFGPRSPRHRRLRRIIPFVLVRSGREYFDGFGDLPRESDQNETTRLAS